MRIHFWSSVLSQFSGKPSFSTATALTTHNPARPGLLAVWRFIDSYTSRASASHPPSLTCPFQHIEKGHPTSGETLAARVQTLPRALERRRPRHPHSEIAKNAWLPRFIKWSARSDECQGPHPSWLYLLF